MLFFIITGTDRLHHFFFDAVDNPDSLFYQGFIDYYRQVDKIIGEITADMEKRSIPFIIISDHGFTKIKKAVYFSQYLKEWGFLHLGDDKPQKTENITEKTRIFALDPSRLYIHKEGKYKKGSVKKEECYKLREEIYQGKYLDIAPDLVLTSNYGFDLKSGITKSSFSGKTVFEGMHTCDNTVLIDSHGFELENHPNIYGIGNKLKNYFLGKVFIDFS